MTRHGISHGAATLVTAVTAALIVDEVREILPSFARFLDELSFLVIGLFNPPAFFTVEVVSSLLLASLMAVTWGMAFALFGGASRR